jgi:roadblock/LC7 domain-containing protein
MKPQTIQIFLPDGSPTSIREAEITNRLVKAVLFPRAKIDEVSKRDSVHFTGVYFLFGSDEDGTSPMVYIGEGEDCFKRIQDHNRKKDFWTHCIVITTKTNEYTKTDVKYLEHFCLSQAEKIGRYKTENGKDSQRPSIPETREHDLLDNFETAKILLATLGYPLFEEKRKAKSNKEIFYCKGKNALAMGEFTDDGLLVHKGSKCTLEESKTAGQWVSNLRKTLLDDGILKEYEGMFVFETDYIFSSPSAAAVVVLARRANGWIEWKDKDGKTLDELKRK